MKRIIPLLLLCLVCLPVRADAIDDAEAKKRGVTVERVQLDRANEKIAQLEKQLADAKMRQADADGKILAAQAAASEAKQQAAAKEAELAKIQTAMTPAQKEQLKKNGDAGDAIAAGIKGHKLVLGMTFEQAKQAMSHWAMPGKGYEPKMTSQEEGREVWEFPVYGLIERPVERVKSGYGRVTVMEKTITFLRNETGVFEGGKLAQILK